MAASSRRLERHHRAIDTNQSFGDEEPGGLPSACSALRSRRHLHYRRPCRLAAPVACCHEWTPLLQDRLRAVSSFAQRRNAARCCYHEQTIHNEQCEAPASGAQPGRVHYATAYSDLVRELNSPPPPPTGSDSPSGSAQSVETVSQLRRCHDDDIYIRGDQIWCRGLVATLVVAVVAAARKWSTGLNFGPKFNFFDGDVACSRILSCDTIFAATTLKLSREFLSQRPATTFATTYLISPIGVLDMPQPERSQPGNVHADVHVDESRMRKRTPGAIVMHFNAFTERSSSQLTQLHVSFPPPSTVFHEFETRLRHLPTLQCLELKGHISPRISASLTLQPSFEGNVCPLLEEVCITPLGVEFRNGPPTRACSTF